MSAARPPPPRFWPVRRLPTTPKPRNAGRKRSRRAPTLSLPACSVMTERPFSQGLLKLAAGADVQLGEHLTQVPLHGAAADEQLCADLLVGSSLVGQLAISSSCGVRSVRV